MNPAAPPIVPTAPAAAPAPAPINPADQYAQLKAAVLGAQVNPAPGASPLGSFPELSKLYTSAPELQRVQGAGAAPNYNSGVDAQAAAAQRSADATAAAQKLKDLSDPSKYTQQQTSDGGYKFYDPLGNEISASQYASVTNKSPADLLKNSQNPIDKGFVQDYNSLQSYIQNKQNSGTDPKAAAEAKATEATVQKLYGVDLSKESPSQIIATFQAAYPTVFGGTNKGVPDTQTLFPDANVLKTAAATSTSIGG